jgi:hypothetical protein
VLWSCEKLCWTVSSACIGFSQSMSNELCLSKRISSTTCTRSICIVIFPFLLGKTGKGRTCPRSCRHANYSGFSETPPINDNICRLLSRANIFWILYWATHDKLVHRHHGMACPLVAEEGDDLQVQIVAANILNKQSRIADKGFPSSLDVGRRTSNSLP